MLNLDTPSIVIALVLLVLSIIDVFTYRLKEGYIPSALSTSAIVMALMMAGPKGVYSGLMALMLALLFSDLHLFDGIADLKAMVAAGIILGTMPKVIIFAALISGLATVYKFLVKRYKKVDSIAFIPLILLSYIITLVISSII